MKKTLYLLAMFFTLPVIVCCNHGKSNDDERARTVVDSFATHYFTWHFDRAMDFATDEMKDYISFIASNVHKADIELLLSTSAVPEIETCEAVISQDSSYNVKVKLRNVILMDTLGEEAHLRDAAETTITVKREKEEWKVARIFPF